MKNGFLITIEGIDGCGKTTLASNLATALTASGGDVVLTKEPGGSEAGSRIRALVQQQPEPLAPLCEYLLFAADRAQHFSTLVLPALAEGKIVISDRCIDSSMAYNGYGHSVPLDLIAYVNHAATSGRVPDLTIYVRVDWETARSRFASRNERLTSIESRGADYWQRVIEGFETIFAPRNNVLILDGKQPPEALGQALLEVLSKMLGTGQ